MVRPPLSSPRPERSSLPPTRSGESRGHGWDGRGNAMKRPRLPSRTLCAMSCFVMRALRSASSSAAISSASRRSSLASRARNSGVLSLPTCFRSPWRHSSSLRPVHRPRRGLRRRAPALQPVSPPVGGGGRLRSSRLLVPSGGRTLCRARFAGGPARLPARVRTGAVRAPDCARRARRAQGARLPSVSQGFSKIAPPGHRNAGDAAPGAASRYAHSTPDRSKSRSNQKQIWNYRKLGHVPFGLQRCRAGSPDCHPGRSEAEIRGPGCRALCRVAPAVLGPGSEAGATNSDRDSIRKDFARAARSPSWTCW